MRKRESTYIDLSRENGGHAVSRHVGLTRADMVARMVSEPDLDAAATFTDVRTANEVATLAVVRNEARVRRWAAGAGQGERTSLVVRVLPLDAERHDMAQHMEGVRRRDNGTLCVCVTDQACVVLEASAADPRGYFVVTAYPSFAAAAPVPVPETDPLEELVRTGAWKAASASQRAIWTWRCLSADHQRMRPQGRAAVRLPIVEAESELTFGHVTARAGGCVWEVRGHGSMAVAAGEAHVLLSRAFPSTWRAACCLVSALARERASEPAAGAKGEAKAAKGGAGDEPEGPPREPDARKRRGQERARRRSKAAAKAAPRPAKPRRRAKGAPKEITATSALRAPEDTPESRLRLALRGWGAADEARRVLVMRYGGLRGDATDGRKVDFVVVDGASLAELAQAALGDEPWLDVPPAMRATDQLLAALGRPFELMSARRGRQWLRSQDLDAFVATAPALRQLAQERLRQQEGAAVLCA